MRPLCQSLQEAFEAFLLGATALSMVLLPLPVRAAGLDQTIPQQTISPKLWREPVSEDQKILHLLDRITFGPRPGDVERVREMGIKAFLDEQLNPHQIDDSKVEAMFANLPSYSLSNSQMLAEYPPPRQAAKLAQQQGGAAQAPGAEAASTGRMERDKVEETPAERMENRIMGPEGPQRVLVELGTEEMWRAVYSNRQLQEVMAQFWMNHFNIYAGKAADRWLLTSFERDVIRPRALGKFEDLLAATAESPAMLFYLDNWMSRVGNPKYARNFNQRPAQSGFNRPFGGPGFGRAGLMRPFGRGVFFPRPAPNRFPRQEQAKKNNAQKERPGINENYGRELMELHTLGVNGGYTQQDVIEVARCLTGWTILRPRLDAEFNFNPRMHDWGPKVVLGHKIPAGRGMEDGLEVLHLLASNPATAHHISLELCQRFIADQPPDSVVDRAAHTWLKTGGDIRAVLKTILTSREFYSQAAYRAKVKSPFELVASALRALGGETQGGMPILRALGEMGQPLFQYQAPSGYYDLASTWINSGSLLMRMNFATLLASDRIPGTRIDLGDLAPAAEAGSPEKMIASISDRILGGPPASATEQVILKELVKQDPAPAANALPQRERAEVATIAGLLIGSPDFQRR